ncbi:MAG: DUF4115 domain-containing protein [Cyanobium sp. PLM2.Bin73]|jgi:hypothetical protein|nr:MAG: DUF4115 domain-containing protein [Cyanobium sp. PLM2.Bin73]
MTRPPENDAPLDDVEQELDRVKAELEEYQGLIEELPSIYEGKFQHQLRDVAQDIRRLLDERQALQQQIDRALQGTPIGDHELPGSEPVPSGRYSPSGRSPALLVLLSSLTALAVAGGVAAFGMWNRGRAPQIVAPDLPDAEALVSAPEPDPEPAADADGSQSQAAEAPLGPDSLRLWAQGECWVEVQTLDGRRVFMATLQEGEQRRLALGEGLRLLAGRPDLLELAIGTEPFSTLGSIEEIDWITLRPPAETDPAS